MTSGEIAKGDPMPSMRSTKMDLDEGNAWNFEIL